MIEICTCEVKDDCNAVCEATFSNVQMTGDVGAQWSSQDIGIASNDAEPLYVAVSNSIGSPAIVAHSDPSAATINAWTQWLIPLQDFADQGINLSNVDKIAIGLGAKSGLAASGGSGTIYGIAAKRKLGTRYGSEFSYESR